jgi:hypothetical protein
MSPLELRKTSELWYIHRPASWLKGRNEGMLRKGEPLNREYDIFERFPDGIK